MPVPSNLLPTCKPPMAPSMGIPSMGMFALFNQSLCERRHSPKKVFAETGDRWGLSARRFRPAVAAGD
jgi:hypothetical protein